MNNSRIWVLGALAIVALASFVTVQQPRYVLRDKPADVRFVTSDIDRFWQAFDEAAKSNDAENVYERLYLSKGTAGLKDFFAATNQSAFSLAETVDEHPKYYRSIRKNTLGLAKDSSLQNKVRQHFEKIKTLYPAAKFQDVYFLIGTLGTGGTTSANGLLLGAEMSTRDASTPTDELSPWLRANTGRLEDLPFLIVHEQVHTLQNVARGYADDEGTLLWKALQEGGADFVAALATGEKPRGAYFKHGLQNERVIWEEFKDQMDGSDYDDWLYNGADATDERPADLGYFVGYRILEAYYNRAADKKKALEAMIALKDAEKLLQDSGYNPR
jgi:Predicted Zn-dependent protease (DUF2268)